MFILSKISHTEIMVQNKKLNYEILSKLHSSYVTLPYKPSRKSEHNEIFQIYTLNND